MRFTILFLLLVHVAFAQYTGAISPISSGYGADGSNEVEVQTITNNHFPGKDIAVFYPQGITAPVPTVFFSHGYGGNDTTYCLETLKHIASIGYAIVFVPYKTLGVSIEERYVTLYDGFVKAARNFTSIIDTTRVGFYGHSFGGGATPGVSYKIFSEYNWGENGRFIFCSAPWYSYWVDETILSNFPADCKMITALYNEDDTNDHRMGIDIFNAIAISKENKDCLLYGSDTVQGYVYQGDHNLPGQYTPSAEFDALDYYFTFRLLDALAGYTFTGNEDARIIALGNGSDEQVYMGEYLSPLIESDNPVSSIQQSKYIFPCDTIINTRRAYCQNSSASGVTDFAVSGFTVAVYPNHTNEIVMVQIDETYKKLELKLCTLSGMVLLSVSNQNFINVGSVPHGMYLLTIQVDDQQYIERIVRVE